MGNNEKTNDKKISGNQAGFFAIEKLRFERTCELGMNAAVAFLVICCGTGKDNKESKWSINAIEKYTGISRGRAKKAVQLLLREGLIKLVKGKTGAHPCYQVMFLRKKKGEVEAKLPSNNIIWIPSGIVQSVAGETPPVERLRQTQDVSILRLFIELYEDQNLIDDNGIAREVLHRAYKKEVLGKSGKFYIASFLKELQTFSTRRGMLKSYATPIDENGEANLQVLFDKFTLLSDMGLIQEIPHLLDSDNYEGEVIHPIDTSIEEASRSAAMAMLSKFKNNDELSEAEDNHFLIPIPNHTPNAAVVGIYQLRYKSRTKLTAKWYQEHLKRSSQALNAYQEMESEANIGFLRLVKQ